MIDVLLLLIVVGVAWCVASDGAWGAGLTLLSVLFGGLLAMNFFEIISSFLTKNFEGMGMYWDFICLIGLFGIFTTLFRFAGEQISPVQIELDGPVYQGARWAFSLVTGYVTMAILLTALHTAPLPREFIGFTPERQNFFNAMAPDRQWLGFTQHVSENILVLGKKNHQVFDAARLKLNPNSKPPICATFPIRYATLRDNYARGGGLRSSGKQPSLRTGGSGGSGAGGGSRPAGGGF